MKNLIKLLILFSISSISIYADKHKDLGTYCFESSHIFMGEDTKVKKVVLHFEDINDSTEKDGRVMRMSYFLEHDERRYGVPWLLISYDKETNMYAGGVECDGGWLEFNATSKLLRMDGIRVSGHDLIMPPFGMEIEKVELDDSLEDIVPISDTSQGWMSIDFLNKNGKLNRGEKVWIEGKKCTSSEDLNVSKVFYTEKEYIEEFKTTKNQDEYIHLFDEEFIEREDIADPIETIQLKKSYTSIADMMNEEGFDFEWMKFYKIRFFMHNNKRAFIHVDNDATVGCVSVGYYLLELNQNTLKKMDFGWESGSIARITIFEPEPVVVPMGTVISKEEK